MSADKDKSKMLFSMLNKNKEDKFSSTQTPSSGPPVKGPTGSTGIREVSPPPTIVIIANSSVEAEDLSTKETKSDRKVYSLNELKSIRVHMEKAGKIRSDSLNAYYKKFSSIYAERTIQKNSDNSKKDSGKVSKGTDNSDGGPPPPPGFGARRDISDEKKSGIKILDDAPGVVKIPANLKAGSSSSNNNSNSNDKWAKGETVQRKNKETASDLHQEKGHRGENRSKAVNMAEQMAAFEEERLRLQEERRSQQKVDAPPGIAVRSAGTFHHETDDIMEEMQSEARKREASRKPPSTPTPVPDAAAPPANSGPLWGSAEGGLGMAGDALLGPAKEFDADVLQSLTGALLDSLWAPSAANKVAAESSAWLGGLSGGVDSNSVSSSNGTKNPNSSSRIFGWSKAEPDSTSSQTATPTPPQVKESLNMESLLQLQLQPSTPPPIQDLGLPGLAALDLPAAISSTTLPSAAIAASASVSKAEGLQSTGNEKVDAARQRLLNQGKAFEAQRKILLMRSQGKTAIIGTSSTVPVPAVQPVPAIVKTCASTTIADAVATTGSSPSRATKVSLSSLFSAAQIGQSKAADPAALVSVSQLQQTLVPPVSNRSTQNLLSKLGIQPSASTGTASVVGSGAEMTPTKHAAKESSDVSSPTAPTSSPFAFHSTPTNAASTGSTISATGSTTSTTSASASASKKLNRLQVLQRQSKVTTAVASGSSIGATGNVRRVNLQGLFNSAKAPTVATPSVV